MKKAFIWGIVSGLIIGMFAIWGNDFIEMALALTGMAMLGILGIALYLVVRLSNGKNN